MKKFSTLFLVASLVAGLSAGCKKKEEAAEPPAQEQQQELPAADQQQDGANGDEAAADEDSEESDQEEDAEEPVVDEAMFIKAAYEVSCVKAKVDNPEEQKEILEIVYPRYGFETVEEYQEAETSFKDSPSVKAALDDKMKGCTVEVARGFKTAGADEQPAAAEGEGEAAEKADEKGDEKAKPAAPAAPYKDGSFTGPYAGTGLKSGRINCSAYRGMLKCSVSGSAEGKGFSVPASGKIEKNGRFDVSGTAGKNKVSLKGQLKGTKAIGSAKLNIFQRDYTANFSF